MASFILSAFADEHSNGFSDQVRYLYDNDVKYIELRFIDGKNVADLTDSDVGEVV